VLEDQEQHDGERQDADDDAGGDHDLLPTPDGGPVRVAALGTASVAHPARSGASGTGRRTNSPRTAALARRTSRPLALLIA
jgi:hypothetical protein